jgi:8-oxo-dGTP pyrophosphatase MutT (NUDIX family)
MNHQKHFFNMIALSVVIVKNPRTNRFLAVKETRNRGWWIPGGKVDPPEDIAKAAVRECKEEGGIDITLKGLIRILYDNSSNDINYLKMKFVFYAEPLDLFQQPKTINDAHSEEARWVTLEELNYLASVPPFLRGNDLVEYGQYLINGGKVHPLEVLQNSFIVEPFKKN